MRCAYLAVLLLSLGGLALADYRYSLAFFNQARRSLLTLLISVVFFLAWDIAGVSLGIFFIGGSKYLSGIRILPEVPLEELLFLTMLSYVTLLLWRKADGR